MTLSIETFKPQCKKSHSETCNENHVEKTECQTLTPTKYVQILFEGASTFFCTSLHFLKIFILLVKQLSKAWVTTKFSCVSLNTTPTNTHENYSKISSASAYVLSILYYFLLSCKSFIFQKGLTPKHSQPLHSYNMSYKSCFMLAFWFFEKNHVHKIHVRGTILRILTQNSSTNS